MDYSQALKKVQAEKPKDNFMLIELRYDLKLVLPYKDGIAFLQSLANAEQSTGYSLNRITAWDRSNMEVRMVSRQDYENAKVATLLDIDIEDVRRMAQTSS